MMVNITSSGKKSGSRHTKVPSRCYSCRWRHKAAAASHPISLYSIRAKQIQRGAEVEIRGNCNLLVTGDGHVAKLLFHDVTGVDDLNVGGAAALAGHQIGIDAAPECRQVQALVALHHLVAPVEIEVDAVF